MPFLVLELYQSGQHIIVRAHVCESLNLKHMEIVDQIIHYVYVHTLIRFLYFYVCQFCCILYLMSPMDP